MVAMQTAVVFLLIYHVFLLPTLQSLQNTPYITYISKPSILGCMIAHKFKITNPQDYGLYLLIDGFGKLKNIGPHGPELIWHFRK